MAPAVIHPESLDVAMDVIMESAPFGRSNQIGPVLPTVTAQTALRAAVPPRLTLKAIVGGPPWHAVLNGIPGEAETVVAIGSDVGGFRVQSITHDRIVLRGRDSTWTLTMGPMPQ